MTNLERALQVIKNRYGVCYGEANLTIEHYMFGFVRSYLVVTTSDIKVPFKVIEFDNIDSAKGIRHFDSRTEAHKYASQKWLQQFKAA